MNYIKKWLSLPLSEEQEISFTAELAKKSLFVALILLPGILLFTTYDIIELFLPYGGGLSLLENRLRFWLYLLLWGVTAIGELLVLLARKDVKRHAKPVLAGVLVYTAFTFVWTSVILLFVPRLPSESIALYFAIVLGAAMLTYLRPTRSIPLFLINHVVFILLFIGVYGKSGPIYNNLFNATIVVMLALTVSVSHYCNARRVFKDQMIIKTKNSEIEEINHKLSVLVHTDALSGLNNRRFLDDYLPMIWHNAVTAQAPIIVLMLDIDDFKCLNDYFGHQAGDKCITQVARLIKDHTDAGKDYVLRYGGEEFAVLMPETTVAQAAATAEAIRAGVEALGIQNPDSPLHKIITVSVGLYGAVPTGDSTPKRFFSYADKALYEAKKSGKNRVVIYKTNTVKK